METNALLQQLLNGVEYKANRGPSANWANYDFEQLSDSILEATGVQLSITTLKRIWGKVKYPHAPAVQTLNTLAQFLGYNDWRDFEQKQDLIAIPTQIPVPQAITANRIQSDGFRKYRIVLAAIVLAGLVYIGLNAFNPSSAINPKEYSFSLDKIKATGVPNSVVFTYDASRSPSDSIFIIQTWDRRRKTLVPKNGKKHSAIYYYPGFFNTKLIIDSTIVQNQDLHISSDGWLGLVEKESSAIYFSKQQITVNEGVRVNDSLMQLYGLSLQPESPRIRFFNQKDLGYFPNDHFDFETVFRNPNPSPGNICHYTDVLIQSKNDIIIIPLADKACVGDIRLAFNGAYHVSAHDDLRGFGCDLTQWVKLKVICRNRHARIYVNDQLAFELDSPNKPVDIVGVQYRFNGAAEIKYSRFWDKSGKLITLN